MEKQIKFSEYIKNEKIILNFEDITVSTTRFLKFFYIYIV